MAAFQRLIFAARRGALLAMLAGAVGFLVFSPRRAVKPPKDRVVIEYWEKWSGQEAAQMRTIVDDFNASVGKDKGIYVRFLSMANVDQKTLAACAAGVPPDVAGLWQRQLFQFASLDALEPLEDLAASRGITEATYKPVFWKACHYDGHLWCLISTPAVVALHYHQSVFRENAAALRAAGLDPTRAPRTIAELDRYAQALETRDASGRIQRLGYLPMEPKWYLNYLFFWFGGRTFDPDAQRITLATPQNIAMYEWVKSYSKRLGPDSIRDYRDSVGQTFASPQNPFMSAPPRLTMELQGPWMAGFIYNLTHKPGTWSPSPSEMLVPRAQEFSLPNRLDNYEWAVAPFPSAVPGMENVTFADYDALVIPRGAAHKQEAFEFIAYVNRQEVMEKLCALHSKPSPLRDVSNNFVQSHPNPYIRVFEMLANSPNAHGADQVPIWPEVQKELEDAVQSVYLLHAEPKDALQAAEGRLQEKFERWRLIRDARRNPRAGLRP